MTCREFASGVDAYLDDELSVMAVLRLHGHLLSCEPCHRMLESREALHALISDAMGHDEAPADLRARIVERARAEAPHVVVPRWFGVWRTFRTASVMIALVLLVVLIPGARRQGELIPLAVELAAKHLLYSADAPSLERPAVDAAALGQWLGDQVGFSVQLPRLGAGERLLGGRLSSVADAPAAYLLYERHGRRISLFVMQPLAGESHSGFERVIDGVELYASAIGHIRLMWWEDEEDGRLYAAAASDAHNELMEFALLCIHSARHRGAPRAERPAPAPTRIVRRQPVA